MKILSIVGARPQFVKAAILSRELRKEYTEILVHTGQHYDANMSDVFFQEMEIPKPNYNLNIGSRNHGEQTGAMLKGIEEVLLKEEPDWCLVYGDTNSTLAGALAAVKLHIKVAHVEAGLRSFNRRMPEEINRVLTDHISDLLLCPTQTAVDNLKQEGITKGVHLVGDVMYEALMWAVEKARTHSSILKDLELAPKNYLLATVHRAENTDDPEQLNNILTAFNQLTETLVWPVHPRTQKKLVDLNWQPEKHIILIEPVGYMDMVRLEENARTIITDSGGIQKEAFWLQVPCITLRDETEWVETVESGWNTLTSINQEKILESINANSTNFSRKDDLLKEKSPSKIIIRLLKQ
ncbi:MAG: UDP-N-acetylglucosamine 2-epimerase (non-hydrolyzing) [Anaerolineaceae bacterium]|nr:UDP-N-acetylglucosamine 2-epimerase (non-hydrolyzing) [Anaerolineaceae bacterium]